MSDDQDVLAGFVTVCDYLDDNKLLCSAADTRFPPCVFNCRPEVDRSSPWRTFEYDIHIMQTRVDFESSLFAPFLPDEAQVNPGIYGAELAFWLSRQLAGRGTVTSYPQYEDWGWFIEYGTEGDGEYWLCCANRDGARDKWSCSLEPKAKSLFGRNKAPAEGARPLMHALRDVLVEEPEISKVMWK